VQSRTRRPEEPTDPYQLIYPPQYFENADARAGPAQLENKRRASKDSARAERVPPEIKRHLDSLKSNMMKRKSGVRGARYDTHVIQQQRLV